MGKQFRNLIVLVVMAALLLTLVSSSQAGTALPLSTTDKIGMEAGYILANQDVIIGSPAFGAINDVWGEPTWVVPGDMAMAGLGLKIASETFNQHEYPNALELAANYLIRVQDADGCWYDQYDHDQPVVLSKSPRTTAEVIIFLYKIGYLEKGYKAVKAGASCLMDMQDVVNKGGAVDGLVGGGKDSSGNYLKWRWTHDNAYAYWAFEMAKIWAQLSKEPSSARSYEFRASRILYGINRYLKEAGSPVWTIAVDENDQVIKNPTLQSCLDVNAPAYPSWIQYAPQMLDVPANGTNNPQIGEWIYQNLSPSNHACPGCINYVCEGGQLRTRKYPGMAFQAALTWYDTGQTSYAQDAIQWAENSSLWQTVPDSNGATGGWIDWVEITPEAGLQAPEWQRFIDTSFYAISAWSGGYQFGYDFDYNYLPFVNR